VSSELDRVSAKNDIDSVEVLIDSYRSDPPECNLDAVIAHLKWKCAPNLTEKIVDDFHDNKLKDEEYDKEDGVHEYEKHSYDELQKIKIMLNNEFDKSLAKHNELVAIIDRKEKILEYCLRMKLEESDYAKLLAYYKKRKQRADATGRNYTSFSQDKSKKKSPEKSQTQDAAGAGDGDDDDVPIFTTSPRSKQPISSERNSAKKLSTSMLLKKLDQELPDSQEEEEMVPPAWSMP